MKQKGLLFIVSGFSGAGKGTIVRGFMDRNPEVRLSISATTRECREGEQEGVHYYYMSKERFEDMIERGEMFEYASYVGNYYGTPKTFVFKALEEGHDVILEIEMQGGLQVKEQYPDAVMVFVVPPHAMDLKKRLVSRGTENMETIKNRLRKAREETNQMVDYDYIIINDVLEESVSRLEAIRKAEHGRQKHYSYLVNQFKEELKAIIE